MLRKSVLLFYGEEFAIYVSGAWLVKGPVLSFILFMNFNHGIDLVSP